MALYQAPEEVKNTDGVANSRFNEDLSHSGHYFDDRQELNHAVDDRDSNIDLPLARNPVHDMDNYNRNRAIMEPVEQAPQLDVEVEINPAPALAAPVDAPADVVNADEWDELAQMMRAVGMAGPWRGIAQNVRVLIAHRNCW